MDTPETPEDGTGHETPSDPQPWVTPTFDRVELSEGLSGVGGANLDGGASYS